MKLMKSLLLLSLSIFIFLQSNAQSQLRVRLGVSKSFNSGRNVGLHRTGGRKSPLPSGIGLEYYRPLPKKELGIITGVFVEQQGFSGGLNPHKFSQGSMPMYGSTFGSVKLYGGIEKTLIKQKRPNANTLSVMAGVAIGINVLGVNDEVNAFSLNKPMETLNGNKYEWIKSQSSNQDLYTVMDTRTTNTLTPELFAGFRWNIKNRQAKTIFVAEGVVNYSLLPKTSIEFPYKLNGKPMIDKIKNHGFNVQLNALIPVKTFFRKNKR